MVYLLNKVAASGVFSKTGLFRISLKTWKPNSVRRCSMFRAKHELSAKILSCLEILKLPFVTGFANGRRRSLSLSGVGY